MKQKQQNQQKNKKAIGLSKNPVVSAFQQAWIWFKETAWIQVILVVILVFGIVLSIPFIVRAATAESDDSTKNIKYLENRRVDYDQLADRILHIEDGRILGKEGRTRGMRYVFLDPFRDLRREVGETPENVGRDLGHIRDESDVLPR